MNLKIKNVNIQLIHLIALYPNGDFPFIGESQGICAISGYLQLLYKNGITVSLYDQQINSSDSIINDILNERPAIIGLSVKMFTYPQFEEFYTSLQKHVFPVYKPLIVVGNSTAHFGGEGILKKYNNVIVALGEGEVSIGDIYAYVNGDIPFEKIRNIMYYSGGEILKSSYQYLDKNLIPFADRRYSKLYYDKGGEVYIEASRGCAYCSCNICECRDFLGSTCAEFRWRDRPINSIIDELKYLSSIGINDVTFSDEDFIGNDQYGLDRAIRLARSIISEDVKIDYRVNARVKSIYSNTDTDELRAKKIQALISLKESGLSKIFLGFESGSPTQLKRYNKGYSLDEFVQAIGILKEVGIQYELGFISLDPLMSLEELEESLSFIYDKECIPYISAVYKELRIQKGNKSYLRLVHKYEDESKEKLIGNLIFDEQMYEILRYADKRVDLIKQLMCDYEQQAYKLYYYLRIQTQYAMDEIDHKVKYAIHKTIQLLKMNDYFLMRDLVNAIKLNGDKNKLLGILQEYKDKRKEIYSCLIMSEPYHSMPEFEYMRKLYLETFTC